MSTICGLESIGKVGSGVTGDIHKIIYLGVPSVLKTFEYVSSSGLVEPEEINILRSFAHPYLLYAKDIITDVKHCAGRVGVVLPLGHYTLQNMIVNDGQMFRTLFFGNMDAIVRIKLSIFHKLAQALMMLHQHNRLHLDIKPHNVIMTGNTQVDPIPVMADFGLSAIVPRGGSAITLPGEAITTDYRPPENLRGSHVYSTRSDTYSMGMLLYNLLTGNTYVSLFAWSDADFITWLFKRFATFHGLFTNEVEMRRLIYRGDVNTDERKFVITQCTGLVNALVTTAASTRLGVAEILSHPLYTVRCATRTPPILAPGPAATPTTAIITGVENKGEVATVPLDRICRNVILGTILPSHIILPQTSANSYYGCSLIDRIFYQSRNTVRRYTEGIFAAYDLYLRTLTIDPALVGYHVVTVCMLIDRCFSYAMWLPDMYLATLELPDKPAWNQTLLDVQLVIISISGGIFNRPWLYGACTYREEIPSLLSLIYHHPRVYLTTTIDKWRESASARLGAMPQPYHRLDDAPFMVNNYYDWLLAR